MNAVCDTCGDSGYRNLLVYCRGCRNCARHLYCFERVILDGSSANLLCFEYQKVSGVVTCSGSLENVSIERPSHAHSGNSTMQQSITEKVESENVNPLSQKCDIPGNDNIVEEAGDLRDSNAHSGGQAKKGRRYVGANEDEDEGTNGVEGTVQTGDLNNSHANNEGPVRKRRRYIGLDDDENEEAAMDVANDSSVQNDVANFALNDGANANLEPQTAVAKDLPLSFRMASDADSADQQQNINSGPIDEPGWSGSFKVNNEIYGKFDAHMSSKACKKVLDLSGMLQPVVEVMKIARLQAWPKKWTSAAPSSDNVGLYFFPHSSRPNEESNKLVNEIIENDEALEVTVGVAKLLIFPSTLLLPEKDQLFQGKYYLWGVFKRRKDKTDRAVLPGEQNGVANATEESKLQEKQVLYQQDDTPLKSKGQETSDLKHIENGIMVEGNSVAQKVALETAEREGSTLPDSKPFCANSNSSEDLSKCSVQSRTDGKVYAPEEVNRQNVLNASDATQSTTECGHGESQFGSGPFIAVVNVRTPRTQQLVEEMVREGALVFPVHENIETAESGTSSAVGGPGLNPDTSHQHLGEHPQSFDFISTGHDMPDLASSSCLELFPVSQENIGWAPRFEDTKEVDLDLSLKASSQAPSARL